MRATRNNEQSTQDTLPIIPRQNTNFRVVVVHPVKQKHIREGRHFFWDVLCSRPDEISIILVLFTPFLKEISLYI